MKIGLINTGLNEDAPPMNLVYLATSLKAHGFNDVRIIDHTFCGGSVYSEAKGLDLIGISAMTRYYNTARKIARQLKDFSGIPVVIGGSHITTVPDSLVTQFDAGVIGEGENTIIALSKVLQQEGRLLAQGLRQIPGIVFWDSGQLIKTPAAELICNLDDIPIPDFGLLDKRYFKKKWIIWDNCLGRSMKIMTSRGCPYNCIFCASKQIWQTVRLHSAERILQEITELVKNRGVDHIYIDDDLFIIDKQRLERVAVLLEQNGLAGKVAFFCSARTNLINEEVCRLLKRVGVKAMTFGFESGSDKVLRYLKGENITVEQHKAAIRLCNKYGFKVWGSLMLGNPTETILDMRQTLDFIDFAIENNCHRIGVFVASPLPGTVFWETAKRNGRVSDNMDWDKVDYANYGEPMLLEPGVSLQEFKKIFQEATAKQDYLLSKDVNLRTMALRFTKCIQTFCRNPWRAISMMRNIIFKKTPQ